MTDAPTEPDENVFVELTSVATLFEAEMKIAVLQDAGISAIIRECSGDFGATPNQAADRGIAVLVHRSELTLARNELARVTEEARHVDWDVQEIGEDAANVSASPTRPNGRLIFIAITVLIATIALILNVVFR